MLFHIFEHHAYEFDDAIDKIVICVEIDAIDALDIIVDDEVEGLEWANEIDEIEVD